MMRFKRSAKSIRFLFVLLLSLELGAVVAQTPDKNAILTDFFKDRGISTISNWAHPMSTYYNSKAVVTIDGSMITLILSYMKESKKFTCTYTVILNAKCWFSRLTYTDGFPQSKCFSAWKSADNLDSFVKIYKSDPELLSTVEEILHRPQKDFDGTDNCILGLNYYWKTMEYRARFLGQE
jgi:hypothetical protein